MRMDMQLPRTASYPQPKSAAQPLLVSLEALAYLALFAFSLVLRFADLDSVPMMAAETHNVLAAWRAATSNASGVPLVSSSPLLFTLQSLSFLMFGGTEQTARLATAFAGALLVFAPLLFRPLIGSTRAFLLALLLTASPVLLITSRTSSPDLWALLFVTIALWGFWQAERAAHYAISAVIAFAALLFLAGAGGFALGIIVLGAGLLTALWRRRAVITGEDEVPDGMWAAVRTSFGIGLPAAVLVVLAVGTGFMLYPAGLSAVSEGIGGAVRAVAQPSGIRGYAALVSLFYEPGLWLFALVSLVVRRERLTTLDVFLLAWVVLGIIASLFFADAIPDHALWLTLPLAALAVSGLARVFAPDDDIAFLAAPRWARWVVAVSLIGILLVFTQAFQSLARSMVQAFEGALTAVTPEPASLILLVVALMFILIGFFLFASLWGNRVTWQGVGLGAAIFLAVTSLGSGWNASVTQAQNPAEFWHLRATHSDTALLRETLSEVADRISGAFPAMPVRVIAPQDGVLAWLLRDYAKTEYVAGIDDAYGAEVVILPEYFTAQDLGDGYVGQDFTISRSWDPNTLSLIDLPALWTQRMARAPWTGTDRVVLWLRADVYQGIDQTQAG